MITRRILVTEVKDANGGTRLIYGRFDAVAIASKGEKIISSEFKNYKMTESDFVKYGKEIMHKILNTVGYCDTDSVKNYKMTESDFVKHGKEIEK